MNHSFVEALRTIRKHCFLSQEAFARELNVSFSSVNRWESGKSKPSLSAMKQLKAFCVKQNIDFTPIEKAWAEIGKEG